MPGMFEWKRACLPGLLVAGCSLTLLQPCALHAQQRIDRFATTPVEAPAVLALPDNERAAVAAIIGAVAGLAAGAGIGYLLVGGSSCDDICAWQAPVFIGAALGAWAGGWIGYRIAAGPKR